MLCQDESDSPRSYEDRSPRNTKQQINKTVPRGRFFRLVRPSSWNCLKPSTSWRLYILVYNSFWLASVAPRRTICDEVSEIPAVVDSESHGSNMGFVGESGVCSFSGNRVRHGTNRITRYMDFTKRRKSLQLVLITTFGLSRNIYSNIVSKTLVLDDLLR